MDNYKVKKLIEFRNKGEYSKSLNLYSYFSNDDDQDLKFNLLIELLLENSLLINKSATNKLIIILIRQIII